MLDRAGMLRTYQLARELADGARTPEDYVQRVMSHLGQDEFTYTEVPPKASSTLEGFLFDGKAGYCQQYSGAMALLVRMAGIPARVVTGFSTGATDSKTGEFVVRDFDAHSWVEVYYPGWGWLTFDPTPADSPARSQPTDRARTSSGGSAGGTSFGGDPLAERGAGVPITAEADAVVADSRRSWRARWRCSGCSGSRCAAGAAARHRRSPSSSARCAGRGASPLPARRCTRSSCASRARPRPPATCARCARPAIATSRVAGPTSRAQRRARCVRRASDEAAASGRGRSTACGPGGSLPARVSVLDGGTAAHRNPALDGVMADDVYDLYQRGMALLEDGHFHQATIPLAKARDLEPDKTSIREALGRAYFRSGGYEAARAEFEAVVERAPTNDYALFCLGRALMQLGRAAEARKPLTLAVNMNPKRRDYRIYRDRARKAA